MLIKVLKELEAPGVRSLHNISEKLGIGVPMLEQLLEDLEQRKYIQKIDMCSDGCASCTHACPFSGRNSVSIVTWETTEKGLSFLGKLAL